MPSSDIVNIPTSAINELSTQIHKASDTSIFQKSIPNNDALIKMAALVSGNESESSLDDYYGIFTDDDDTTLIDDEYVPTVKTSTKLTHGETIVERQNGHEQPRGRKRTRSILKPTRISKVGDDDLISSVIDSTIQSDDAEPYSEIVTKKRKRVSFGEETTVITIDQKDVTTVEKLEVDMLGQRSGHFLRASCTKTPDSMLQRARERSPHQGLRASETAMPPYSSSTWPAQEDPPPRMPSLVEYRKRQRMNSPHPDPRKMGMQDPAGLAARNALGSDPVAIAAHPLPECPDSPLLASGSPTITLPKGLPKDIRRRLVSESNKQKVKRNMRNLSKWRRYDSQPPSPVPPSPVAAEVMESSQLMEAAEVHRPPYLPPTHVMFSNRPKEYVPGPSCQTSKRNRIEQSLASGNYHRDIEREKHKELDRVFQQRRGHKEKRLRLKLKNWNGDSPRVECVPLPQSPLPNLPVAPNARPIAPLKLQATIREAQEAQDMYEQAKKLVEIADKRRKNASERALRMLEAAYANDGRTYPRPYYPTQVELDHTDSPSAIATHDRHTSQTNDRQWALLNGLPEGHELLDEESL